MASGNRSICIAVLVFLCVYNAFGTTQWVNFNSTTPEEVEISLIQSTNTQVVFDVTTPGMYVTDQTYNSIEYDRMRIIDGMITKETGYPEVPEISVLLCVPQCSDIQVSASPQNTTILNNYLAFPVPTFDLFQETGIPEYFYEVFNKNETAYQTSGYYPSDVVEVSDVQDFRDQPFVVVKVRPVLHDPVAQKLKVYYNLRVTVSFTNGVGDVNVDIPGFEDVAQQMFLNGPNEADWWRTHNLGEWDWLDGDEDPGDVDANYLIVAADPFVDVTTSRELLEEFAEYRAGMNRLKVKIVKYTDIPMEDEEHFDDLWTYVNDIYQSENGEDRLRYLLIVGDAYYDQKIEIDDEDPPNELGPVPNLEMIETADRGNMDMIPRGNLPANTEQRTNNDYYFSRLHGDEPLDDELPWTAQIMVGRFPVGTHDEFERMIDKIMNYESQDDPFLYKRNMLYICGERGHEDNGDPPIPNPDFLNFYSDYCHFEFEAMSRILPQEFNSTYIYPYEGVDGLHFEGPFDNLIEVDELDEEDDYNEEAKATIYDQLEDEVGSGLIMYFAGHGTAHDRLSFGWMEPNQNNPPQVPEFDNDDQLPLMFFTSCMVGRFDYDGAHENSLPEHNFVNDGWAEILTVKSDDGAIGTVAAPHPVLLSSTAYGTALSSCLRQYPPDLNHNGFIAGNLLLGVFNNRHICHFEWPIESGRYYEFQGNYSYMGDPGLNMFWRSQTVTGLIDENTSWRGKVVITGNVTVAAGVTLTIHPGTEVIFKGGDWDLNVLGRIVADGNNNTNHIVFRSMLNDQEGCLYVYNSNGNGSGNIVRYCEFVGMYIGLYIRNSDVECEYVKAHDCFIGIDVFDTDGFEVSDVECFDNDYGITIGHEDSEGDIYDANCHDNQIAGFYAHTGGQNNILFWDCLADDNGSYGVKASSAIWLDLYHTRMNRNGIALYAATDSWPWLVENNALRHSDPGPEIYLHYADIGSSGGNDIITLDEEDGIIAKDVTNPFPGHNLNDNYLGPTEYLGTDRFDPDNAGWIFNDVDENPNVLDDADTDEEAFNSLMEAVALARNAEYRDGVSAFRAIIDQYPDSRHAVNALNGLYYCTGRSGQFDQRMRTFLLDLAENTANEHLQGRARRFATRAYLTMGMYEEAIREYENRLRNVDNFRDSVQTAMELAHAFFLANGDDRPRGQSINSIEHSPFCDLVVGNHRQYCNKLHQLEMLLIDGEEGSNTNAHIPKVFFLNQNYPNPFNSYTEFKYGLPENVHASLKIFDTMGREVVEVFSENKQAGFYTSIWDGRDKSGKPISSGLYLYQLKAGDHKQVRKLTIIK